MLTVTHSAIEHNQAQGSGGGLANNLMGQAHISASTLAYNSAHNNGGGIINVGQLTLVNVTVSGNRSRITGSGIHNSDNGIAHVFNSTIAFNEANTRDSYSGGEAGLYNTSFFWLYNSIVAGNFHWIGNNYHIDDCHGSYGIYGNVYVTPVGVLPPEAPCQFVPGAGDAVFVTAFADELGPLANNGGPTLTHALLSGNPALDGAANCMGYLNQPVTVDQRGFPRPFGAQCDSGAVEQGSLLRVWLPLIKR